MPIDSKLLTPTLQSVWADMVSWVGMNIPSTEIFLTCTHRSIQEQARLYAIGRTTPGSIVTKCDGVKNLSKHNHSPARAFDFAIKHGGVVVWGDNYFKPIIKFIKESRYKDKVVCGADFSFKDWPHIEEK